MMDWQVAVSQWKQTLENPYTLHSFGEAVKSFFRWAGPLVNDGITADLLEGYVSYLIDRTNAVPKTEKRRLTRGTLNKYLYSLYHFLRFCLKKGWLNTVTLEELQEILKKRPASVTRPYEILDEDEIRRLMEAAQSQRDKCMIALGLFAGLRNFEICNLKAADLGKDSEGPYVVVKGKGSKEATVALSEDVYELLGVYKAYPGRDGRLWEIAPYTLLERVKKCAARAGIEKHITVHSLRHTYAYRLFKSGVPVLVISKMLRHASLAITTVYLSHLSREETARYAPSMPS